MIGPWGRWRCIRTGWQRSNMSAIGSKMDFQSPAYDLTYSNSIGGEHATMVSGNGKNPGMDDILAVAKKIGLNTVKAKKTASDIKECVFAMLGRYIKNRTG